MRILIIGGTGNLSARIAEACAARGDQLLLFNRGSASGAVPAGARTVVGDRNELGKYRAELLSFRPDAVIDAVLRDEKRAREAAELFPSVGRYVFLSTVDVYGEDVGCAPVDEDREPDPKSSYGKDRLAAERFLFSALPGRAAAFRLSHILGRGFLTGSLRGRTPYLVDRIRRGKPVPAIDGGRNLMTPVHARDAAEWIRRSLDFSGGAGLFNACGPEIITQRRYYETVAEALGVALSLRHVPAAVFARHFDSPAQYAYHRPYSNRKITELTGYGAACGPRAMMAETVDFMVSGGLVRNSDEDPFDDELVALLERQERELDAFFAERASAARRT